MPGLGTLKIQRAGATADFTNKLIAPPTSTITFNDKDTDATALVNYYASVSGSNISDAKNAIEQFSHQIKEKIGAGSTATLDQVGEFSADDLGNTRFKAAPLPPAFLAPVPAERVIHPDAEHQILVGDKETTNTVMSDFFSVTSEAKDRWWIWAIVLALVALTLLYIYFSTVQGNASFGNGIKI